MYFSSYTHVLVPAILRREMPLGRWRLVIGTVVVLAVLERFANIPKEIV